MGWTVTIKIANIGTPLSGGGYSRAGHMWYELSDGNGESQSFGFGPKDGVDGRFGVPGDVKRGDNKEYSWANYSRTFSITEGQYQAMLEFGLHPESYGFSREYNAITNSCVDYVWMGAEKGGLNPGKFEGYLIPIKNILKIELIRNAPQGGELGDVGGSSFGGKGYPFDLPFGIGDFFKDLFAALGLVDPLILDLDGNGIQTVGARSADAVYFDYDGDGIKTKSGWLSRGDGLLVIDRNRNGKIESGAELFSNFTPISGGRTAADGFAVLRDLDSNGDGVIDKRDESWASLRVWRDGDGDGLTGKGELLTLDALGIVSFNVGRDGQRYTLPNGNVVDGTGSFKQVVDGKVVERQMADVWFTEDTLKQQFPDQIPLRDDVIALPYVEGSGNVRALWQAASMATPEGEALRGVLRQVAEAKTATEQKSLIESLLKAWAGTSSMQTTQSLVATGQRSFRGASNDADWLTRVAILEKMGGTLLGANGSGSVILTGERAQIVARAWDTLTDSVYKAVAIQTRWRPYLESVRYRAGADGQPVADFSGLEARLGQAQQAVGLPETLTLMAELTRHFGAGWKQQGYDIAAALRARIQQSSGAGLAQALMQAGIYAGEGAVDGSGGADVLLGSGKRDLLSGGRGDDYLYGGDGDDTLSGGAGNDVLDGGAGDDRLDGGSGSDTYLFGRRSGNDTISESADYDSNTDVVQFDADVRPGDVTIRRDGTGDDLLLTLSGSGNTLRIRNYFYQDGESPYMIEELRFADGTVWTFDTVLARTLKGGAGNDTIVGSGRNDVIDGGAGDDWLEGRGGSDTYLFGRGSGKDTIYNYDPVTGSDDQVHFGANIAADQIWLEKKDSDLQLTLLGTGDSVTIRSWYSGSSYHVDRFRLQNGKELADNNVDKLVDAMAAFAPPASGQTSLPADYRSALAPVLAANWK